VVCCAVGGSDLRLKAILLGSAAALSTIDRDNSSLAVQIGKDVLIVDCNGTPARKLAKVGLDFTRIDNILISHHHPDHIYGLPSLLHEMLLRDRKHAVNISCPETSLEVLKDLFDLYFREEQGMFEARFIPIELGEKVSVLRTSEYEIQSSPMVHGVETLAYRFDEKDGKSIVYISDTAPNENLVRLASGTDVLFHDCNYPSRYEGKAKETRHTTALQAGKIARDAGVKKLVLIHIGQESLGNEADLIREAKSTFPGEVLLGYDFMVLEP